jgi:hypothetical protein
VSGMRWSTMSQVDSRAVDELRLEILEGPMFDDDPTSELLALLDGERSRSSLGLGATNHDLDDSDGANGYASQLIDVGARVRVRSVPRHRNERGIARSKYGTLRLRARNGYRHEQDASVDVHAVVRFGSRPRSHDSGA